MVCMFILNFCFKITSSKTKTKYYQMITGQDAAAGNKIHDLLYLLADEEYIKH